MWYIVFLVLVESVAMDNRNLCIRFTDFNKLITMLPDKKKQTQSDVKKMVYIAYAWLISWKGYDFLQK